jgi:hypothetical protein
VCFAAVARIVMLTALAYSTATMCTAVMTSCMYRVSPLSTHKSLYTALLVYFTVYCGCSGYGLNALNGLMCYSTMGCNDQIIWLHGVELKVVTRQ